MATTVHEAHDRYSDDSITKYHEWMQAHPDHNWTEATVDRFRGLTLLTNDPANPANQIGLHFAHALCGYVGQGPSTTVKILEVAGFGSRERFDPLISSKMAVVIEKRQP